MKRNVYIQLASFLYILTLGFILTSLNNPQDQKPGEPWDIPDEYKEMKNPYADDKSLLTTGRKLYIKQCKSCHGTNGKGDGIASAE
ncbi:MAG: hypothetical protein R3182_06440, partial [Draconibacterium sp.]|nr:hypothetical protein [Draconibacterium sp.]